MVGRQLPFFSVIVPFWLITAFVGLRKTMEIWPPILVAGVSFAIPQYLVSNFHGPWLVDVVAAIVSMASLALFLKVWRPAKPMTAMPDRDASEPASPGAAQTVPDSFGAIRRAWIPWLILSRLRVPVGNAAGARFLDGLWAVKVPDRRVARARAKGAARGRRAAHRSRGVQLQYALGDGHGDFARGDHLRSVPGLSAGGSRCARTGARSTSSVTRC